MKSSSEIQVTEKSKKQMVLVRRPFMLFVIFISLFVLIPLARAGHQSPSQSAAAMVSSCVANPRNIIRNGGFESGKNHWTFYTNGKGSFDTIANVSDCGLSARLLMNNVGSNTQLNQRGFALKSNTRYRLSFSALSGSGHDLRVYLHKQSSPYTNYGLNAARFNLTNQWQDFSVEFTTKDFSGSTSDTRLRFWFPGLAASGDAYLIDNVVLELAGASTPTSEAFTATATTPATATATTPATATATTPATATATSIPTSTPTSSGDAGDDCSNISSLLNNPSFESGTANWTFYTNGSGSYAAVGHAFDCSKAVRLTITRTGSNVQLNQSGFPLKANTRYRVSFAAHSSTGRDLALYIHRQTSPYTNYGVDNKVFDLAHSWGEFSYEFTTKGFSGTTSNSRLRFWLPGHAVNGESYWIDKVIIEEVGASNPPPTATPKPANTNTPQPTVTPKPANTNTPQPTATSKPANTNTPQPPTVTPKPSATNTPLPPTPTSVPAGGSSNEMIVFDWNEPVTEDHRGFPWDEPPTANGSWTTPINFAQGTFHYRAEILHQPVPQNMRLQFCVWQAKNGVSLALENCGSQRDVVGSSGNVVTWSEPISNMWQKGGKSIEWWRARERNGVAIKNSAGRPVSDYNNWNWNGEDPKKWYTLNMRFTVVVVAKGASFSGWDNHISTPPGGAPTATATSSPPTATPTSSGGASGSCSNTSSLLNNPSFESGTNGWIFHTSGSGSFGAVTHAFDCNKAVRLTINKTGSNVQLNQSGFPLQANKRYRVSFAAYSNTGHDLALNIHRQTSPYTNYGADNKVFNLTTNWREFSYEFTTTGFSGTTNNSRLRFWFPGHAVNGDIYWIDKVILEQVGASNPNPTATPIPAATPMPTATPKPGGSSGNSEMLIFELDRNVGPVEECFAKVYPLPNEWNGDWTGNPDFPNGTMYFRAQIYNQPVAQDMYLQFCIWQQKGSDEFGLENCSDQKAVRGTPGNVVTWSTAMSNFWKKNGQPIDWTRPRRHYGIPLRNSAHRPISECFNYNGENPSKWFPLKLRFQTVFVANGAQFSGWNNYP